MSIAERVRERFRKRLARWVEKKRAEYGCAKRAIKDVATKIGMSSMGVRRVLGRYGHVHVQDHHHVALLIHMLAPKRGRELPPLVISMSENSAEPLFVGSKM